MAEFFFKYSCDAAARTGWQIRKNLLERTGCDNQRAMPCLDRSPFFPYHRAKC